MTIFGVFPCAPPAPAHRRGSRGCLRAVLGSRPLHSSNFDRHPLQLGHSPEWSALGRAPIGFAICYRPTTGSTSRCPNPTPRQTLRTGWESERPSPAATSILVRNVICSRPNPRCRQRTVACLSKCAVQHALSSGLSPLQTAATRSLSLASKAAPADERARVRRVLPVQHLARSRKAVTDSNT